MATAWPAIAASEVLSGKGAKTVAQGLFDRQTALPRALGTTCYFPLVTTASAAYVTLRSIKYRVPDYAVAGLKLRLYVRARVQAAATGVYRVVVSATNGTDSANITSTSFATFVSEVTVQAGWAGTVQTLLIQGKTTASTLELSGEQIMANLHVTD